MIVTSLNQDDINASLGAWASGKRSPMFNDQASASAAPTDRNSVIRRVDMSAANDFAAFEK